MKIMKKIIVASVLMIAAMGAFAKGSATVLSVKGKVEVQRNAKWVQLKEGDLINEGEMLNTGFKSEATLKYEGTVLNLSPLTRVVLEKLASSEKKDTVSAYLKTGALRAKVSHLGKKTEQITRSPTNVASVRGTGYSATAAGLVEVEEGAVAVIPAALFDAAAFGIENPADGKKGATSEEAKAAESVVPADGESNPNTSGKEISPLNGGRVVSAGYSVDYSNDADSFGSRGTSFTSTYTEKFDAAFGAGSAEETVTTNEGNSLSGSSAAAGSGSKGSVIIQIILPTGEPSIN